MITGKDLMDWGLKGKAIGTALKVLMPNPKGMGRKEIEVAVKAMVVSPESFIGHKVLDPVAKVLISEKAVVSSKTCIAMSEKCCPIKIFGDGMIEQGALNQIYTAAKLPVSVKAALMPDGHQGIGICIGGVIATRDAVIPNCVGVDIGCRVKLTVFDVPASFIAGMKDKLVRVLQENTVFGKGNGTNGSVDHKVIQDDRFNIPRLKKLNLRIAAASALGSSGSGNHFCEFGSVVIDGGEPMMALLSHSGSRGVGNKIAKIYADIAAEKCRLDGAAKSLAWLKLDDPDGQEYWEAMNLAGDFSKACHDIIHGRIAKAIGAKAVRVFENHHNFAWKENILIDGEDVQVIVHRKGATPAGVGVYGVIPGSSTTPTYIVRGKGNPDSICSSSHGAGRLMSRSAAKQTFTVSQMKKNFEEAGVTIIGGSLDECSMAYKSIDKVMEAQEDLVEIVGSFDPKIVRMSGEEEERD